MSKTSRSFFDRISIVILLLTVPLLISNVEFSAEQHQEINRPPLVEILKPYNNTAYEWDTPVRYLISVSDKEDGESKYDEIAVNEVFLEVEYASVAPSREARFQIKKDPQGLAIIKTSNCLNCHAFNSRLIGPSFFEISQRYKPVKTDIDLVGKRIKAGSVGVWGSVKMPSHPELNEEQSRNIAQWIIEKAGDPKVNYYSGVEGIVKVPLPAGESSAGVLIFTASYTDHGLKDQPNQKLKGQERIILQGN
jgi:cytochrome c